MKTYDDLLKISESEADRMAFISAAISEYRSSEMFRKAYDGYEYYCKRNVTIRNFQKFLYEQTGEAIPDNYSPNYKFANGFFPIFVKQEVSHLLGNGVNFNEENTKEAIGGAEFDHRIYKAAIAALWGGVSYGFYNNGNVQIFTAKEFVPLFGEEDGALHAGIRFWQISSDKPMRATLYEEDGYTEYLFAKGKQSVLHEKRAYIEKAYVSDIGGETIYDFQNYEGFPIVPLWANEEHESELDGLREKIDGYDLIQSGFANDLDEASFFYWTIQNAGGMDDADLKKFIRDMKLLKAATVDENGSTATPHTMDVPYEARSQGLQELRDSLYRDAMALDTDKISGGQVTATAIRASYENLDLKTDGFEMCVTEFVKGILELAGIDDDPTYKRNRIANLAEETQMVLAAAQYLDDETILRKLPFINIDEVEAILDAKQKEEASRYDIGEGE